MESVSFDTLTFDHPAACRPARLTASLHLPVPCERPAPCMVILTSSAGVQRHREHYYAQMLNEAGTAALIVDSFTGRGVRRTVADVRQSREVHPQLRQGAASPRLDRAKRPLQPLGDLRLREVQRVTEHDDLALVLGQLRDAGSDDGLRPAPLHDGACVRGRAGDELGWHVRSGGGR